MARTLTETLTRLGHASTLVDRRFSTSVADIGRFSWRKVASALWMPIRLIATLVRFRPDVVIFFATTSKFSFQVDWALSELLRRFRVPVILYLHTVGFRLIADRGSFTSWQVSRLLGGGRTVVTLGPSLAFDIADWVDESDIAFIPNTASEPSLEARTFDPNACITKDSPMVLYLSNLMPAKGGDTFVEAAIQLCTDNSDTNFVLAGAPVDEDFAASLVAKIEASPTTKSRFVFAGAITDSDQKWELLQAASILAFASTLFEAQPLTILEALSVGTPVVAFDVGGVRDILRDGIDGYLVPAGDHESFTSTIANLLDSLADPREQQRVQESIQSGYIKRFSLETYAQNWYKVLVYSQTPRKAQH